MYGSDAPFHHAAVEILRVRVSGLDDAELEEVLHRSGRKLFLGEEGARKEEVTSLGATG
jgi:predicted TIM-barrel fold metal-dependent hydrolase